MFGSGPTASVAPETPAPNPFASAAPTDRQAPSAWPPATTSPFGGDQPTAVSPFGGEQPTTVSPGLPWGSSGGAAAQDAPASVPPPAGAPESPFGAFGAGPGIGAPDGAAGDTDEDDEWDDEPEPSYTWLHYIILVVVAFVLGLLLWKLVLTPDEKSFETDQASVGMLVGEQDAR